MRDARSVVVLLSLAVAAPGCSPSAIHVPAPVQPSLEAVRLAGNRVCGNLTASSGRQFNFACPALPTIENSGWELTPVWEPAQSPQGHPHANRSVVITVSAPTLTDIDVELARQAAGRTS